MQRLWHFLTDKRVFSLLGFVALAVVLFIAADQLEVAPIWVIALLGLLLLVRLALWLYERRQVRRAASKLENVLEQQATQTKPINRDASGRDDVAVLRQRMMEAINTIKTSKLGQKSGAAALYELPWYMVIGNPSAGKSTAIANSGLHFPFADKDGKLIHGVGGTRNCDWFFTTDGILLDTAGRYSVGEEDRHEWFSFLDLLKRYRKQAPINGVIIAVSIAELTGNRPEFAINLAKNLRQRVQELTERLEVFAPVYVVFTKTDLITGFDEFFIDTERDERDRVWGATLAYDYKCNEQDVINFFDERFDELHAGLKEMSLANMSLKRGEKLTPGVLAFPLEFLAIKGMLRSFVATLFEENPFQFKPVFRGFYFTSALQEGPTFSVSSQRITDRFGLTREHSSQREVFSRQGLFLHKLFKQVIFADAQLVAQYTSRNKIRMRYVTFFCAMTLLGALLGGWSWSYMGNRQLVANVQADMEKAIKLQERNLDLQSRFEALEILQDRIEQLARYRSHRPVAVGLGLYQGDLLERKLREEYFAGIREIMLKPVASSIETYLMEVNANAGKLESMSRQTPADGLTLRADSPAQLGNAQRAYKDSSTSNVEDAYNALKTYLMLASRSRAESSHLSDQITRFWRGWLETNRGTMPREQMIRRAERLISFSLEQINDPSWPTVENKLALVDQSRENLNRVVRGMPARERVYADVKARAATRFASMTVARIVGEKDKELVMGSYAIPGTFTREAWEKFVQSAFREAANKELQSADWVLKTSSRDDLTLEGSPEQIQKALVSQYKIEFAREWQKFLQGVSIVELRNLDDAANAMNRLGDPLTSPLNKVISTVFDETSWDNPSLADAGVASASKGLMGWLKEAVMPRSPSQAPSRPVAEGSTPIAMGPVGQEFAGVARLVTSKDKDNSLLRGYLENLSKLRTRLNAIRNQGDTGPGAKLLMQQTLEGSGSELSDSLKFVDEEMLPGLSDQAKSTLRPLLVRPLVQGFNALVHPTEGEVNKIWRAQVYEPFQSNLAAKYPFSPNSKIEANSAEVGAVFGENGAISKFMSTAMGQLVVRRGDALWPRRWADMGITLSPIITTSFANWISTPGGTAAIGGVMDAQTVFQIQPLPTPGALEYTVEIDGQQLRYRNTPSQWNNFVWPNPHGSAGARVSAVTYDGRTVEVASQPGRFGLERLINTAQRKRKDDGTFELSWTNEGVKVVVNLKIISSAEVSGSGNGTPRGTAGLRGLKLPETIVGGTPEMSAHAAASSNVAAARVQLQTQSIPAGARQ